MGWLAAWVLGVAAALASPAADAEAPRALGVLTPFYRSTQVQGHLFGMGLTEIPAYLLAPDLAFGYRRKAGFRREVPFVDSFSINRVLGGYRADWLQKFRLIDPKLGRRSLDYVVRRADGTLQFRPELIRARVQPYLEAGYRPADITLALDNTPWDLATPTGAPPLEGAWGRRTPPGDLAKWSVVVRHLMTDLKTWLGPAAAQISFETGIEYDERASFDGNADAFFRYYAATGRAVHDVLPGARFGPGEFTGLGECAPAATACVYDTSALLGFARAHGMMPSMVPRSLHAIADRAGPEPSRIAAGFVASYARLPPVTPEVHQFGLLFEPFGETVGSDVGPMQASWEFQTLVRLMATGRPRRVFHWGGLIGVGDLQILNGSGFLRLVLDHYLGRQVVLLAMTDAGGPMPFAAELTGVALPGGSAPAVVLSSFSAHPAPGTRAVSAALPASWGSGGTRLRAVRYRAGADVFAAMRQDLAADGNLRPEFGACALCTGTPMLMARDAARARAMLLRDWPRYQALIEHGLRWQPAGGDVTMGGGRITASLGADELLVLEPMPADVTYAKRHADAW